MFSLRPHILQIKETTGGGYDENGNPIPAVVTWSDPIPCHVRKLDRQRIFVYADGSEGVYNYDVWFDPGIITEDMDGKYCTLKHLETGKVIVEDKKIEMDMFRQLTTKFYL